MRLKCDAGGLPHAFPAWRPAEIGLMRLRMAAGRWIAMMITFSLHVRRPANGPVLIIDQDMRERGQLNQGPQGTTSREFTPDARRGSYGMESG